MYKKITLFMLSVFLFTAAMAQNKNVTFQVDNPDSTQVYVFGSWSGWGNWPGTPMTNLGNGKFSVTISIPANATHEFLYVNGNPATPVKETLDSLAPCTNGNPQYTNRVFAMGANDTAICYTWATCNTCQVILPPANVNVKFQLANPDSLPVYAFGSWNGWNNYPGHLMTDPNNDGIYDVTLSLPGNTTYEFKYVNGATPVLETLDPTWPCTNGNAQYTNRVVNVGGSNLDICNLWSLCDTCNVTPPPANVNVTFQVSNPDSIPVYVFGSWSGWGNFPGDVMTDANNDGIYDVTLSLPANTTYEFKYLNGNGPTFETLNPAWPCTNGNAQYTNRVLNVGASNLNSCNLWSLCDTCGSPPPPANVNVTFQVANPDSLPVYAFGSWSGWGNYPGEMMTDPNNDGIYDVTVSLPANATYEWKYVNGATPVLETLNPAWPCTNGNAQYTNRVLNVDTTNLTICNLWSLCDTCGSPPPPPNVNVTFQVSNPDSIPVYVFGSWSGWGNFPGDVMTDPNNDGIYDVTLSLPANTTYEFKYLNGNGPTFETLNPAWPCTNGNAQYTNRVLNVDTTNLTICNLWSLCDTCGSPPPPPNVNVTFQVSNPDSIPVYVFGSWSGWGNFPGDVMTDPNNDGIYDVTLSLPANTTYEFKYLNGNGPTFETLNPAWPCTNGNAQYTNRVLNVDTTNLTICNLWSLCDTCGTITPGNVLVTFEVENPDSIPVYVFGSWSGWGNYPGHPMTDANNDGIYDVTLSMPANATYEFKYLNGNGPTFETLNPAWSCTNGNGQYTNRVINVGNSNTGVCYKWALCDSCGSVTPSNIDVTFMVNNPDSLPVYVFGSWSGWSNWPGTPMSSIGNGNYQAILSIPANSTIEYLFVNGTGPSKEVLDPAWPCTNGNAQYTNRMTTVGAADTTLCAVWATCNACPVGLENTSLPTFGVYLNSKMLRIITNDNMRFDQIEIYDLLGREVFESNNNYNNTSEIPVNLNANSIYLIRIKSGDKYYTFKAFTEN